MAGSIITLTTDFGIKDPYVAEMKAVILSLNGNVTVLDVSHGINKYDIRMGAFVLASVTPYFPTGTIHVAVVDPTVGSQRRAILIETEQAFFIGPDNGILTLACRRNKIKHVFEITNKKMMLPIISGTFHGRDLFAPAAAHLANGVPSKEFGPEIHHITYPTFARPIRKEKTLQGEVIYVDDFGNIVTNFCMDDIKSSETEGFIKVKLKRKSQMLKLCKNYSEVAKHETLILGGSHGFLEIAANGGNAAKELKVTTGDKLAISVGKVTR
jgi:S-adenosylmethionine hydrolase